MAYGNIHISHREVNNTWVHVQTQWPTIARHLVPANGVPNCPPRMNAGYTPTLHIIDTIQWTLIADSNKVWRSEEDSEWNI